MGEFVPLAVVAIGAQGDGAIMFGAYHAPAAMLAADQPAFAIDGVAIGVVRRLTEDAEVIVVLDQAHHPVVRNVAENQVAARGEIGRTLGPAKAGRDPLNRAGAGAALETLFIDDFDVFVGIAGGRQWPERKPALACR